MQQAVTYDVPLVSTRYAGRFIEFLRSKNISKDVIKTHHPQAQPLFDNPDAYLSMNQAIPIIETGQWLLNDEQAAFEFGQQLDLGVHGLFGYMLLSGEDHPQLIETVVKHMRVCLPLLGMEVLHEGQDVIIRLHDTWNVGMAKPFLIKIYMGSIYTVASALCKGMRFECGFKSVKDEAGWKSIAPNSRWTFNSQYSQVILPNVRKPHRKKDLDVVSSLAEHRHLNPAQETPIEKPYAGNFTTKVQEYVMKFPGQASIERSAEILNMSSRYLRQQLAKEGTSFREISNEIRQSYADLYLSDTPMPLNEIAHKLGFGDQASFTRAYRSWTGSTPGEMRRRSKQLVK